MTSVIIIMIIVVIMLFKTLMCVRLAVVLIHSGLELLTWAECHHATRGDRNLLACLGIAPRTLAFVTQIEVAETGQLHLFVLTQAATNLIEEDFDHRLGFALGHAKLCMEMLGEFRLGQRSHVRSLVQVATHALSAAPKRVWPSATIASTN